MINKQKLKFHITILMVVALQFLSLSSYSQYFGRNKPSYKSFNYKVYRTPHFEIYHYLKNDSVLNRLAQLSEQWYELHQTAFQDTFETLNPIIFYNDQSDFQQTTAISGELGIGTGGVTEALKNRVILPIASTYAQTDHVLGHEMVHAFQYHLLLSNDSANMSSFQYIPLWMIEGMAEYFSIGSVDPNTAMWMRDAIANNDFPSLDDMSRNTKYFPYRYGQCFWSMIGRTWGDSLIIPIFKETSKYGYDYALKQKTGFDSYTISQMWKQAMVNHYQKYLDIALNTPVGKKILFTKTAGEMNISPSVSPDGKYVVFYSEKDAFTFDLFLAEAKTGKIIRRLSSTVQNSEVDAFNYIESAGTWSPDGSLFAFPIFSGGRNKLMVVKISNGRTVGKFDIPNVPSFNNPAWNPTNDKIAVSGMVEGENALFVFDLKTKNVTRLTNDHFSYLQPNWSSDGTKIAFSTDKPINNLSPIDPKGGINLGIIDVNTLEIKLFPVFDKAKNLNPLFSHDNNYLYFLSNRDGFRNLYKYAIDSNKVYQMTNYFTGISGITEYAPAVSIAHSTETICYSYYYGGRFSIYSASLSDFKPFEVATDSVNFDAATMPPMSRKGNNLIDHHLNTRLDLSLIPRDSFTTAPYRPQFKLDYISNVNVGVAASRFGTGMAGSVFASFSDIVGQNQIYTTLAVNGQIYDFGGQLVYFNSKNKYNWGTSISHIPYLSYYQDDLLLDTLSINNKPVLVKNAPISIYRIFEDKISFFVSRPLSATQRFETGFSTAYYSGRYEVMNNYYDTDNYFLTSEIKKLPSPKPLSLFILDGAYVIDNSIFGMTAPIRGKRIRLGVEQYVGDGNFFTLMIDYRRYFYVKPFTIAIRAFTYGRYGNNSDSIKKDNALVFQNNLYLGYPWYIRGYEGGVVTKNINDTLSFSVNDLLGSRIALTSFEFRIPFFGPRIIHPVVKSGFLFTDLVLFCDAGFAWTKGTHPVLKWKRKDFTEKLPIVSIGASMRFNVLGYMVLEPYYAFPLQSTGFSDVVFGLNFLPGW